MPACLVCKGDADAPEDRLLFYSRGNCDSPVYSPPEFRADFEHIVIALCNRCLRTAGNDGLVTHGVLDAPPGTPLPGEWVYSGWVPERCVPGSG